MKVLVMPVDNAGVGHYRLRLPAQALADQGYDIVVDQAGPKVYWDRSWPAGEPPIGARVVGIAEPPDADIVVFQRPTVLYRLDAIRHLRQAGIRVVIDVDDRLDRTHKRHMSHKSFYQPTAHHEILDTCCSEADLVTCSTPALADRYGHGHAVVLPNLIPRRYLDLWGFKRPRTVGWAGVLGTHPGDLETTGGAVQTALDRNRPAGPLTNSPWTFHVIGEKAGIRQALRLDRDPSATGIVPFDLYPQMVAELEIGVVPLELSEFNAAKSCLKAMEMASVEVPVVMSPTPDNLRLHRHGVGLVAESRGQWVRHLSRLMWSPGLRADLAGRSKEAMAGLTYEEHCGRWWDAWQTALDRQQVPA